MVQHARPSQVTDAGLKGLAGMTQLQSLDISSTHVTGLQGLAGMTQLQTLGLTRTRVTDAGLKEFEEALPKCRIH